MTQPVELPDCRTEASEPDARSRWCCEQLELGNIIILRVFTNLNPSEPRAWVTGETFEVLAQRFTGTPGLPTPKPLSPLGRSARRLLHAAGLGRLARPPYDRWMLRFHNFLKEQEEFQRTTPRTRWEFPPMPAWLVFTDMVSHAVLSGQYALEQIFLVGGDSLVTPEKSPARILERLATGALTL